MTQDTADTRRSAVVRIAFGAGVLALAMVGAGGPLWRFGLAHYDTGFALLRFGHWIGALAVLLGLIAMFLARKAGGRRDLALAVLAVVLGGMAAYFSWSFHRGVTRVPPIHDITTDTQNPPAFIAIAPLREADGATNPPGYAGDSVAALQRAGYPDLQSVIVPVTLDSAFISALATARELGWEVVDANPAEGRIEATERSGWWGFRDDMVVRIQPASGVSRVDVRSKSRVGVSDSGVNAARIRRFLDALQEKTGRIEL